MNSCRRSCAIAEPPAADDLALPLGADGVLLQSQIAGSPFGYGPTVKPTRQPNSSPSLAGSPVPTLMLRLVPLEQSCSSSGEVVMLWPGAGMLPHQQLPVLPAKSSHQKSVPLGLTAPPGATPIRFAVNELLYEVETFDGSQPGTGVLDPTTGPQTVASGAAKSITPRRRLSQKWLWRRTLSLPPAIHSPVPTGTGMNGLTSESAVYGL